jgi:glycosyltransferase involved in cell wall biosynthesis
VVIYHGVDKRFAQALPNTELQKRYALSSSVIFYPASTVPTKNHALLLHAFQRMKARSALPHQLVLAGLRGTSHPDIMQTIASLGLTAEVTWLGWVPAESMPQLYLASDLMVFPSQFEGFGLPVLEAMACGRPLIVSNRTALPEIAGDAALAIDPNDPEAWCEAMYRVLTDDHLRARLVERGSQRVQHFRWDTTARQTLQAYHQVREEQLS